MKTVKGLLAILLVCALSLATSTSKAQNAVYPFYSSFGNTTDTVTNTGTDSLIIHTQRYASTVSIQPIFTKISGTPFGKIQLYGSVDGVTYSVITGDTVHVSSSSVTSGAWVIKNNPFDYYKIKMTGVGTMSGTLACKFLPNKASGSTVGNYSMLSPYSHTTDTITNTATNYVTLQVQNWYETITFQATVTYISGTPAGTVTLQGSNDGVNYVTVPTGYLSNLSNYGTGGSATYTVTNYVGRQAGYFVVIGNPFNYYRLSYTGSGTMSCSLAGTVSPSK